MNFNVHVNPFSARSWTPQLPDLVSHCYPPLKLRPACLWSELLPQAPGCQQGAWLVFVRSLDETEAVQ